MLTTPRRRLLLLAPRAERAELKTFDSDLKPIQCSFLLKTQFHSLYWAYTDSRHTFGQTSIISYIHSYYSAFLTPIYAETQNVDFYCNSRVQIPPPPPPPHPITPTNDSKPGASCAKKETGKLYLFRPLLPVFAVQCSYYAYYTVGTHARNYGGPHSNP